MDYLFLENIQLQNNTVRGPRCHRWGIRSSPFGAVRSRPCFFWHASSHLQLIYHFLTGGESPYGLPPSPVASSPGLAFLTCLFAFTAHLTFLDRWEIPYIRPARGTLHAASCLMLLGNGSMNFSGSMMLSDLDLRTTRYFWLFRLLPTNMLIDYKNWLLPCCYPKRPVFPETTVSGVSTMKYLYDTWDILRVSWR